MIYLQLIKIKGLKCLFVMRQFQRTRCSVLCFLTKIYIFKKIGEKVKKKLLLFLKVNTLGVDNNL